MNGKRSIRLKITLMVLGTSVLALLILGLFTLVNINGMKNDIVSSNNELGRVASSDSAKALEQQTLQRLESTTGYLAQVADEKLGLIKHLAVMLADSATELCTSPDSFAPSDIAQPMAENTDKLAVYFVKPRTVELASVTDQAQLAANAGLMMKQFHTDPAVLTCYISFNDGLHVICDKDSGLRLGEDYDYDPRPRSWFKRAQQTGEAGFTDIVNDALGRGLGIVCSAPFYDKDGMAGAVGVGALISEVDELILSADLGSTGEAFALNSEGKMLIGGDIKINDDGSFERPDIMENEQLKALGITGGGSGVSQVNYKGRDVYMAWTPIQSTGWILVTTVDVDEALSLARETGEKIDAVAQSSADVINKNMLLSIMTVAIVLIVTAACVSVVGARLSKKITDPLKSLTDGVSELSSGDLDVVLELKTGDEIETLADAFNSMTVQLKDYIKNLTAVTAEKERIGAELHVATTIQASMLPSDFPAFPQRTEFDIYATMTPAKEVGGDFYDFFLVDSDHLAVVIADVSGKGVPAALFMVITKTLIKNQTLAGNSPADVFTSVNAQLCENNEAEMFVTGWMGVLEISTGKFIYVNAGHNPPLLKKKDGGFEYLKSRAGFVLAGMEGIKYRQNEMRLETGDVLYLYTDGVTEATDAHEELYGEQRLQDSMNSHAALEPKELLVSVKADVDAFVDVAPQFDDMTMVALKLKEPEGGYRTLDIPAKVDNLGRVLDFISNLMDLHSISDSGKTPVLVASEEIFVSIAECGGLVRIMCRWPQEREIELTFISEGAQCDLFAQPDPDISLAAEDSELGGLGIYMVKKSMDSVSYKYEDGKNVFTITNSAKDAGKEG